MGCEQRLRPWWVVGAACLAWQILGTALGRERERQFRLCSHLLGSSCCGLFTALSCSSSRLPELCVLYSGKMRKGSVRGSSKHVHFSKNPVAAAVRNDHGSAVEESWLCSAVCSLGFSGPAQSLAPAAVTALCLVSNSAWPGPWSGSHRRRK